MASSYVLKVDFFPYSFSEGALTFRPHPSMMWSPLGQRSLTGRLMFPSGFGFSEHPPLRLSCLCVPASVCEQCVSKSSTPQYRVVTQHTPESIGFWGKMKGRGLAAGGCNGTTSLTEVP